MPPSPTTMPARSTVVGLERPGFPQPRAGWTGEPTACRCPRPARRDRSPAVRPPPRRRRRRPRRPHDPAPRSRPMPASGPSSRRPRSPPGRRPGWRACRHRHPLPFRHPCQESGRRVIALTSCPAASQRGTQPRAHEAGRAGYQGPHVGLPTQPQWFSARHGRAHGGGGGVNRARLPAGGPSRRGDPHAWRQAPIPGWAAVPNRAPLRPRRRRLGGPRCGLRPGLRRPTLPVMRAGWSVCDYVVCSRGKDEDEPVPRSHGRRRGGHRVRADERLCRQPARPRVGRSGFRAVVDGRQRPGRAHDDRRSRLSSDPETLAADCLQSLLARLRGPSRSAALPQPGYLGVAPRPGPGPP